MLTLALVIAVSGIDRHRRAAPTIVLPPQTAEADGPVARRGPIPDAESSPRAIVPASDLGVPPADDPPQGDGPRGTSGEAQDDGVGRAKIVPAPDGRAAIGSTHPGLPEGSYVEITALDTGRTIVALVVGRGSFGLTPGAAQQLGIADGAAIRVRAVTPSAQDQMALRSGQAAPSRLDAPPALLTALRRQLSGPSGRPTMARAPIAAPARAAPAAPPAPMRTRGALIVQVATLSARDRAAALAARLGGRVAPVGKLYRVQLGPFADAAAARRARDGAAQLGYADARILPE